MIEMLGTAANYLVDNTTGNVFLISSSLFLKKCLVAYSKLGLGHLIEIFVYYLYLISVRFRVIAI